MVGKVNFKRAVRRLAIESLEIRQLLAFNPTAIEQELIQLTNRFRTDPRNEFDRMIAVAAPIQARDPLVTDQLRAFQVDGNVLRQELQGLSPLPPLGWNETLQNLAVEQNSVQIAGGAQSHTTYSLTRRLLDLNIGMDPTPAGMFSTAQNAFDSGESASFIHVAYVIDWGTGKLGSTAGMQNPRGHRLNIMNADFTTLATPVVTHTATKGPLWNTQFFARIHDATKFAMGAVFEDKNRSGWYDAGEGVGNVQITFQGPAGTFSTTALSAGGYQIALPAGTYTATASGGSLLHSIALPSVTVGSSNVWANFIYDPAAISPDAFESNNTLATATPLTGRDQTLNQLSIHSNDLDYFRFTPVGTGSATISITFTNSSGNIDLRVLNVTGGTIASSITAGNTESVTLSVIRGTTYFVQVSSDSGATNPAYSLLLDQPEPAQPVATADRATWEAGAGSLSIPILANDSDSDSPRSSLTPTLQNPVAGMVLNADKTLTYTPVAGTTGVIRASYTLTDDQGLVSLPATIEIFVLDFSRAAPWQNSRSPLDVNDDGLIRALDALLIINELKRQTRILPRSLSATGSRSGFLDTDGSNTLSPVDALLIINHLRRAQAQDEGEGEGNTPHSEPLQAATHDIALLQMTASCDAEERKKRR